MWLLSMKRQLSCLLPERSCPAKG